MPSSPRQGLLAGISAYLLWGLFPPYFALLAAASPLEILAERVFWSFWSVLLVLVLLRGGWSWVRTGVFTRKNFPLLAAAAGIIAVNWLTYIWAVNNGHVVEASMGYFINPLVSVLLGVLVFSERLGLGGRIGIPIAFAGVVVISWGHFSTIWISLLLAFSFGLYGVVKKRAHLSALQGLLVESGLLLPLAVPFLGYLMATGHLALGSTPGLTALLVASGAITAFPLWLFAIAAPRLSLGILGVLQYVAPTMQFLFGILLFREPVSPSYWVGLVLIWIGSAIYLTFTLRRRMPEPLD